MSKTNKAEETTGKQKAADDDPTGSCQFTNASGQLVCLDNVKKSECDQIQNSVFSEDGSCQ